MNDNKITIEESYAKLPTSVTDFIDSEELEEIIYDIGKNNQLHIDQIGDLEDLIALTIIGRINRFDFKERLESVLKISNDQVEVITKEINERIFIYINELLRNSTSSKSEINNDLYDDTENASTVEIINAISNPSSLPTKSTVTQTTPRFEMPKPLPPKVPTAPLPDMPQSIAKDFDEDSMHIKKLTDVTVSQTSSIEQNISVKKPLIPADHIERIASDPYKENVI
jgi:hypothetical protein